MALLLRCWRVGGVGGVGVVSDRASLAKTGGLQAESDRTKLNFKFPETKTVAKTLDASEVDFSGMAGVGGGLPPAAAPPPRVPDDDLEVSSKEEVRPRPASLQPPVHEHRRVGGTKRVHELADAAESRSLVLAPIKNSRSIYKITHATRN